MASQNPPPYPPGPPFAGAPFSGDPRAQRRFLRDQARAQRDLLRAQQEAYRAQARGMRRGSIVGPLFLVVLGVVFFLVQTGHVHAQHLWEWYGRWWPLLLVGVGALLLGEWFLDQRTARAGHPVSRRVGAGLVILVIFLGIFGVAASSVGDGGRFFTDHGISLVDPESMAEFLGDKHESDQTITHSVAPQSSISIQNPRGDVAISGTSDDGQIHIAVHKEVYSRSDSDAGSKADQLTPVVDGSGSGLAVHVPSIDGGRADLTITVPATAQVALVANHGDLRANSLKGNLSMTANHGNIDASGITGDVAAHINNGDASFSAHSITGSVGIEGHGHDLTLSDINGGVSMGGEFFGTTHLERINGPVRFHTSRTDLQFASLPGEVEISPNADLTADQVAGPVTLNTRNRNITLERISGDLSVTNRNGSVDLTGAQPLGNVTVENRHGSVNLTLPNNANFVVDASTTNGDLENDFSLPTGGGENHPSMSGNVGKGGPLVRLSTSEGDIALKKGSIAPLAPLPPLPPKLSQTPSDVREAVQEAREQAKEAAQEAKQAGQEAAKEARDQARDAQRQADETRREALQEAEEARREAKRQADEARREAKRQAEEAQHDSHPQQ